MKRARFFVAFSLAFIAIAQPARAQTPIAVRYTATTENVGMTDSIRVELFRWSTAEERDQLLAAWKMTAPAAVPAVAPPAPEPAAAAPDATADNAPPARGARGGAPARGAAGAARGAGAPAGGGRGAGAPADGARGAGTPARGARGAGANRGARGGGGPAAADATPTRTPEGSLAAALGKVPTVGRVWSSEAAGYSIRYAVRLPEPSGGERIVLIADRRLNPDIWKPATGSATNYDFCVFEARLDAKGMGEAKASLTARVTFDADAGVFALENYAALPVLLKNFQRRAS